MKIGKTFFRQVSLLTGTTVGAGIFALPFAFASVGIAAGLLLFGLAFGVIMLINFLYAWIVIKTEDKHEFSGYAGHYLGIMGKLLSSIMLAVLAWGAMLAFANLAGSFLASLFLRPNLSFIFGLYYLIFLGILVLLGFKFLTRLDILLVPLTVILTIVLFLTSFSTFSISGFLSLIFVDSSLTKVLGSFGVFLFALAGFSILPDVLHLGVDKKKGLAAVLVGSSLPAIIYLIFSFSIISLSRFSPSADLLSGVASFLPKWLLTALLVLGTLTTSSAFLGLGNVLKNSLEKDFKIVYPWSWFLVLYPPLLGYLLLEADFAGIISVTGLVSTVILMGMVGTMALRLKSQ